MAQLICSILEQAGAELCQAQTQVGLPAEAELILVLSSMQAVFHILKIVVNFTRVAYKCYKASFADSKLIRSSSPEVVFY